MVILADYQWRFNDLLFGAGTDYEVISHTGIDDNPDVKLDDTVRAASHGSFLFGQYYNKRVITIEGDVAGEVASGEFTSRVQCLKETFLALDSPLPLTWVFPGLGTGRRANVIPTRLAIESDYNIGYAKWVVELQAEDPRLYDDTQNVLTLEPGESFGLTFNVTFNVNFGGGTTGTGGLTNQGTISAPPEIHIKGPATNPKVIHLDTGDFLKVNITLASSNDYLDLNWLDRTVLLNGYASRYGDLDPASKWWTLAPGDNSIQFVCDAFGGQTECQIKWRSAYI